MTIRKFKELFMKTFRECFLCVISFCAALASGASSTRFLLDAIEKGKVGVAIIDTVCIVLWMVVLAISVMCFVAVFKQNKLKDNSL